MDTSFRDATEDDLPAVLEIYNDILNGTATFHTEPQTLSKRVEWLIRLRAERYPCLVAELSDVETGAKRTVAWASPALPRAASIRCQPTLGPASWEADWQRHTQDGGAITVCAQRLPWKGHRGEAPRMFARGDEETGRAVPCDHR
ncbi:hypothetical protein LXA43DRAFT_661444 [Ganoderma leucocontextum]|nr:hypothetical protein LXA43DRAFT_661444 [Ganoderma leucocontextum]